MTTDELIVELKKYPHKTVRLRDGDYTLSVANEVELVHGGIGPGDFVWIHS